MKHRLGAMLINQTYTDHMDTREKATLEKESEINSAVKKKQAHESRLFSFVLPMDNQAISHALNTKNWKSKAVHPAHPTQGFYKKDIFLLIATFTLLLSGAYLVYELQPSFEA